MLLSRPHLAALLLTVLPLLPACGSDDDPEVMKGTAPTIADLSATPATAMAGQTAQLSGTVSFQDPDGDVRQIATRITLPNGQSQELPRSDLANTAGQTSGTVQFALFLVPPTAGSYTYTIRLFDAAGNESNSLEGKLEVN